MTFLPAHGDVKFAISRSTSPQDRAIVHSLPWPSLAHLQVLTQPFLVLLSLSLSFSPFVLHSCPFLWGVLSQKRYTFCLNIASRRHIRAKFPPFQHRKHLRENQVSDDASWHRYFIYWK